jgi:hypothetical protein
MTQRKAPRGRIRGDGDPMGDADPMRSTAQKCRARSKQTGNPCRQWAIPGGTVCVYHGGKAPQTEAKAKERLMALQAPAIETLAFLMKKRGQFPSTAYAAARDVLDRTEGKATEKLEVKVTEATKLPDEELRAKVAAIAAKLGVRGEDADR